MSNKGSNTPTDNPQLAGLGEKQTPTQEQAIPHTYFAGVRNLKVIWIMQPVDQFSRESDKFKSPKNALQPFFAFNELLIAPFSPLTSSSFK